MIDPIRARKVAIACLKPATHNTTRQACATQSEMLALSNTALHNLLLMMEGYVKDKPQRWVYEPEVCMPHML